ncbi:hypothetical protein BGW36DRAFT_397144 [Talaromyces proteolyticus]|uniref:Uncharacterized protein n=1 Tax=Talaromyces proteolyticus TaxID=1131652 RepID=A0AAD4PY66_9EURO|nr:uncharacterized protein BGW36DRAFT_397144 [Talaromyces proteolyticus]KAH8697424.1 hypothetical protein BGW36DRAFT_397144 [Talaromyces proteolyticus]
MWLARGVQSAVFYYVTCTPCAAAVDRRRRKRDAARVQREQAKSTVIITDQPRPFAQPTPFSTNSGWMEEIALGPGPPTRRHRANKNGQNEAMALPRLSATSSTTVEDTASSEQDKAYLKTSLGDRFHWARFQREDEVLWGEEEQQVLGSSVGFSGRARAGTSHSSKYSVGRAPPVNDLHPPIVSGPTSRAETRWMLQPPPTARVMAGKAKHDDSVRTSREPSIRKKATRDMKIEEAPEDDEVQEGQSVSVSDLPSWLPGSTNSNRKTSDKKRRPAPVTIVKENSNSEPSTPQYPPLATLASRPESMAHIRHAYDEWHFQISSTRSDSPSSLGSPVDSFHCPDTPYSRPESKRTEDSGKAFRSPYSSTASPGRHGDKSIEAIRVEVNEPKTRDEKPLKWRWSFDV